MAAVEEQMGVHDALAVVGHMRVHRGLGAERILVEFDRFGRPIVADGEVGGDPAGRALVFVAFHATRSLA